MSSASRPILTAAPTQRLTVSRLLLGLLKFCGALALLALLLAVFVALLSLPAWPLINYLLGDGPFLRAAALIGLSQVCLFPCYVMLLLRGTKHGIGGTPQRHNQRPAL